MAFTLPAAMEPGPHPALPHQVHAMVLKVNQGGQQENGLRASHRLINDLLFSCHSPLLFSLVLG